MLHPGWAVTTILATEPADKAAAAAVTAAERSAVHASATMAAVADRVVHEQANVLSEEVYRPLPTSFGR